MAGRIQYDPPLPADRDQLTQRLPLGSVIKFVAIYDEPFWRRDGLSGQGFTDARPARGVAFDNSPPDGSPGVINHFVSGDAARQVGRLPEAERRRHVLGALAQMFGPRAARPDGFLEKDWAKDEWSRGCYHSFGTPGALTSYGPALRRPVDRLHWAGTETGARFFGSMSGALESGERAANEVLSAGVVGRTPAAV
jgi:monoamine oxidase